MKTWLPLLVVAIYSGCGFGPRNGDFSAALPHGYFVHRTSGHQIMIAPQGWTPDTPIVPTKVVEMDHDDHFLIAKQQLLERRSPHNPNDTYEQPKPNSFQYWILDLQSPRVCGPLTLAEFEAERSHRGVPQSLRLHDVYDYRP